MYPIKKTYRLFAVSMATLMLLTACVFTVDIHYCQGHFKSFSLNGKAKACYEIAACPMHQDSNDSHEKDDKNCCHNESFQFQADNDLVFEYVDGLIDKTCIVTLATLFIKPIIPTVEDQFSINRLYRPPPLLYLYTPAFLQSFLL